MSTVWVAGGTGMLGQAVANVLTRAGHTSLCTGHAVDITDPLVVQAYLAAQPALTHIVNCAAMTAVDACEGDEAQATRVNAHGPANVAAAAAIRALPVLHISTDYVFDGRASRPYAEDATCAPMTAYGRSKWAGEQALWRGLDGRAPGYVVRTSWLFGHGGNNFVATMLRLMRERERVQVVCDQIGSPTFCDDLAHAIVSLLGLAGRAPGMPGTYHFANSGQTSWHGLAEATFALAQQQPSPLACQAVEPVTSAAFVRPAQRPAYSVLQTRKVSRHTGAAPRPWHDALAQYVTGLAAA